jgi:Cu(I)/Ag(I) efflux system protein CusF
MKALVKAAFITALALTSVSGAFAQSSQPAAAAPDTMSSGEVKKIDQGAGKITIKHGPLENLGMGAMTMVFRVTDPAMLAQVKTGDRINFVAEAPNGELTVTKLEKQE